MSESYSSLDVDIIDWDAKAEKCIGRRFGPISCQGIQFLGSDRYINERAKHTGCGRTTKVFGSFESTGSIGGRKARRGGTGTNHPDGFHLIVDEG